MQSDPTSSNEVILYNDLGVVISDKLEGKNLKDECIKDNHIKSVDASKI